MPRLSKLLATAAFGAAVVLGSAPVSAAQDAIIVGNPPKGEPGMWLIKNGETTVYLFGSVHVLPRYLEWRTTEIDKAIKSADIFVFEAPLERDSLGKMNVYVREHSYLPRGKSLSKMLSPEGLKDFKKLLEKLPVEAASVNVMQPWKAYYTLEEANSTAAPGSPRGLSPLDGVDYVLMQEAKKETKTVRYFETAEGQAAMLASSVPDDMKSFEAALHDMLSEKNEVPDIINTWYRGDVREIAKINANEAKKTPQQMRVILDERNKNWIPQIDTMLTEKKTFFITVGAAHLAGKGSVVELLCGEGWKVQRLKTGPTTPPAAACPVGMAKRSKPPTEVAQRH